MSTRDVISSHGGRFAVVKSGDIHAVRDDLDGLCESMCNELSLGICRRTRDEVAPVIEPSEESPHDTLEKRAIELCVFEILWICKECVECADERFSQEF